MEEKTYRFKRNRKIKNNKSIFPLNFKALLPKLKKFETKKPKIHAMLQNYGNVSTQNALNYQKPELPVFTSITPKLRSTSSNSYKTVSTKRNIFLRASPDLKHHMNVRYLHKDFDEIEQINTIKTPEDSQRTSKEMFFKNLIPTYEDFIANEINNLSINCRGNGKISRDFNESTQCGSRPSGSLAKDVFH